MDLEEKAHEILEQWHERFLSSPIHQRIAAKLNEEMEQGIDTKIDDLEQSAANEHADAIMLGVLGQALGDYAVARTCLSKIQKRFEMLSDSVSGHQISDEMSEYVASRIHAIQIEEISNAITEANRGK